MRDSQPFTLPVQFTRGAFFLTNIHINNIIRIIYLICLYFDIPRYITDLVLYCFDQIEIQAINLEFLFCLHA